MGRGGEGREGRNGKGETVFKQQQMRTGGRDINADTIGIHESSTACTRQAQSIEAAQQQEQTHGRKNAAERAERADDAEGKAATQVLEVTQLADQEQWQRLDETRRETSWWTPEVQQIAEQKFEALSVSVMISGLKRRMDMIDDNLRISRAAVVHNAQKSRDALTQRAGAAEEAMVMQVWAAMERETVLKNELNESMKIKNELFKTSKLLSQELQSAQREHSAGTRERDMCLRLLPSYACVECSSADD